LWRAGSSHPRGARSDVASAWRQLSPFLAPKGFSKAVIGSTQRKIPDQSQDAAQRGHIRRAHAVTGKLETRERHLLLGRKEDLGPGEAVRGSGDDRRNLPQFPDGNRAPVADTSAALIGKGYAIR